jgi:hypothetical protein
MAEQPFDGHAGRECGEHRTTGARAWCSACSEWCYPEQPCKGCELPMLRARLEEVEAAARHFRAAILVYEHSPMRIDIPPSIRNAMLALFAELADAPGESGMAYLQRKNSEAWAGLTEAVRENKALRQRMETDEKVMRAHAARTFSECACGVCSRVRELDALADAPAEEGRWTEAELEHVKRTVEDWQQGIMTSPAEEGSDG